MIYCAYCGASNPAEARFCYRCGKPVLQSPGASFTSPSPQAAPNYTYTMAPPPGYVPVTPEVTRLHPLADSVKWIPYDLQSQPRDFYSYVNLEEKLVFARQGGFWKRFLAAGLDLIILSVPYVFLTSLQFSSRSTSSGGVLSIASGNGVSSSTADPLMTFLLLGLILGYFFIFGLINGQSLGKRALSLRVMRLDGRKPDWLTAAVRYLTGYLLSANLLVTGLLALLFMGLGVPETAAGLIAVIAFGWGFWWAGWDELKQGWHDKLARTLVVDTREYVEGVHFIKEPLG